MVETAIVMPVIITIWMTIIFAQRVASSKLDTLATARGKAWNYATGNCGDPGDKSPWSETTGDGQTGKGGGAPLEFVRQLMGNVPDPTRQIIEVAAEVVFAVVIGPFNASTASKDKSAQVASKGGGSLNFSAKLSSKSTVICNEPPLNGNFENVFKSIWRLVTKT